MARVKLTEHKAKSLLYDYLGYPYSGVTVKSGDKTPILSTKKTYVVKVDQGVKKRMKNGLVKLNVKSENIKLAIDQLGKKGYDRFIIEQMLPHESTEEKYIAIERTREGMAVTYSKRGGIDIEDNASTVKRIVIPAKAGIQVKKEIPDRASLVRNDDDTMQKITKELGIDVKILKQMREFCDKYYVSFLEINPLVVIDSHPGKRSASRIDSGQARMTIIHILDLAVEVDSTAQFFVASPKTSSSIGGGWTEEDIVSEKHKTQEELEVANLNKKSQAALSMTLLNPNGSIWVLLSGGGASITLADEVHNLGFGRELGNYGEYSGNPNAEETYLYTCQVLASMLRSNRRRLILIIGGGVANFTDIRITFKGIINALEKFKNKLKKKHIKVFVRRGGPHEKEGLQAIEEWLKENKMLGFVAGPNLPLNEIVGSAIKELKK